MKDAKRQNCATRWKELRAEQSVRDNNDRTNCCKPGCHSAAHVVCRRSDEPSCLMGWVVGHCRCGCMLDGTRLHVKRWGAVKFVHLLLLGAA